LKVGFLLALVHLGFKERDPAALDQIGFHHVKTVVVEFKLGVDSMRRVVVGVEYWVLAGTVCGQRGRIGHNILWRNIGGVLHLGRVVRDCEKGTSLRNICSEGVQLRNSKRSWSREILISDCHFILIFSDTRSLNRLINPVSVGEHSSSISVVLTVILSFVLKSGFFVSRSRRKS
jgi:hypothetical protein